MVADSGFDETGGGIISGITGSSEFEVVGGGGGTPCDKAKRRAYASFPVLSSAGAAGAVRGGEAGGGAKEYDVGGANASVDGTVC